MTGQELIRKIASTQYCLSDETPVLIVYRDVNGMVTSVQEAGLWTVLNGKICIEGDTLKERKL